MTQTALEALKNIADYLFQLEGKNYTHLEAMRGNLDIIRATLTHPKPSSAGALEECHVCRGAETIPAPYYSAQKCPECSVTLTRSEYAALQPQKDNAPIEGLREAIEDHYCASDAILGKNIDILAKAARRYLALTEGNIDG